jgi:VWFA-related protein
MASLSPRIRTCRAAGAALALLVSLPALGQQEPSSEEAFSEVIEVSVVSLDVFVTDRKGKPLTGLAREDFEIYEDGKPVEITNFYAETSGKPPAAGAAQAPAAQGSPEAAPRPQDQRLRLVIFMDDVNTRLESRATVLNKLDEFLKGNLRPGDQAMLVRYDRKLDIRRAFTDDFTQLDADLEELKKVSADLRARVSSRINARMDVFSVFRAGGRRDIHIESRLQSYAEQEAAIVAGALDALGEVVSWLAGVPGRKAILYVSDGLALEPGYELFEAYSALPLGRARMSSVASVQNDATDRFRKLTAQASRNRVAIYPLEASGGGRADAWQEYTMNAQNGLRFLAQDTGGRALLNAADPLIALQSMSEDLAAYYSLGYQPQREGDEREHKIEVRVKAKGAKVRHRQWYRDKTLGESVAERALAVMRFGPEDNPLDAKLEIGEQKAKEGGVLVPVRVRVPLSKLYLTPKEGSRTGSLRLFVVASGAGEVTPVRETEVVTVNVPEAEAAAGKTREYVHDVGITLKPGSYAVGVAVRDEAGAVTSYLRKEFEVGAGEEKAAVQP